MDESFSTHYQIHHLNSAVASSYLKGGGISEVQGGISEVHLYDVYEDGKLIYCASD